MQKQYKKTSFSELSPVIYSSYNLKMNKLILLTLLAVAAISYSQGSENLSEDLSLAKRPPVGKRRGKTWKGRNGKKSKKGGNGQNTRNRNGKNGKKSGRMSDNCYLTSMNGMKMWKDIVGNFQKQTKRMEKQIKIGKSKNSKNGVFESVYQKLLSAGGGNISALSCDGSTTSEHALQMTHLARSLSSCQPDLEALCNTTNWAGLINETHLQQCEASTSVFKDIASGCLEITDTESACACWETTELSAAMEAVKTCRFQKEAKAVAKALMGCTTKFGKCRKYEDDAVNSLYNCSTEKGKQKLW